MSARPCGFISQAKLKKWTPSRSGARFGYADVQLPSGLVINGLRIMTGANGLWVAMPAVKQLDRNGNPRLDTNGKQIFNQIVEFKDKTTADRFRDLVLELVLADYPGDLVDGALEPRQAEARSERSAAPARRRSAAKTNSRSSTWRMTSRSTFRPGDDELAGPLPNDEVAVLWPRAEMVP